jgi:hypothetical protein
MEAGNPFIFRFGVIDPQQVPSIWHSGVTASSARSAQLSLAKSQKHAHPRNPW